MSDILTAALIMSKWERARDSLKRLYLIDKEKGQSEYDAYVKQIQTIIKKYMVKYNVEAIGAILNMTKDENDGHVIISVLAAGFELLNDNDLTL